MSLFTETEAKACTIVKTEKVTRGSDSWIQVIVKDDNSIHYDMDLKEAGADPSTADLKTAIIAELLKMNKKPTGNERVLSTTVDKGVGETLG